MRRIIAMLALCAACIGAATPVETHGWLSVKGNKVVDERGSPANLRGMSFFWSQWIGKYWNAQVVDWLVDDWNVSVVRAAMAVDNGGYLTTPAAQEARVRAVVEAAIARGIYVIIDWHDHDAIQHEAQAIEFFERMARDYGRHPHVIYEIYNEPTTQPWWEIKGYATRVSAAIRKIDPTNLIIVGNPSWSAEVDKPAADPVPGTNIAYTLHFYAASHGQWLRDRAAAAMNSGIALFATEWGTCEYTGDGALSYDGTRDWLAFMEEKGISWANWSIADKDETCAALVGGASSRGGWSAEDLTPSGAFLRSEIRSRNQKYSFAPPVRDTFPLPGIVDASRPVATIGTRVEPDATGSGRHLAYIDAGTAASYTVKSAVAQSYAVTIQVAGENSGGSIRWLLDGREVGTTSVSGTGGWQNWATVQGPTFTVGTGPRTLRLEFTGTGTGLFNLKSLDFKKPSSSVANRDEPVGQLRRESDAVVLERMDPRWTQSVLLDLAGSVLARSAIGPRGARLEAPREAGPLFVRLTGPGISRTVPVGLAR